MSMADTKEDIGVPFLVPVCCGAIMCTLFYAMFVQDAFFTRGHCYFNDGIGVAINVQGELFVDEALFNQAFVFGNLDVWRKLVWLLSPFPLVAAYWVFQILRPMFALKGYGWEWFCLIGTVVVLVMILNMPERHPISGISHLETERMRITPDDIPSQHEREVT